MAPRAQATRGGWKRAAGQADDVNVHISAAMRALIQARDWLTVIRLPSYAPDLNPTEGVWSHLKRSLGNLAATGIDDAVVRMPGRWRVGDRGH